MNLQEFKTCFENFTKQEQDRLIQIIGTHQDIIIMGNGGSSAISSHIAEDYTKMLGKRALTFGDTPMLSCYANDYGYEDIFVRQLKVLGKKNDLLIAISASGNSPSLIKAFEYAKSLGIYKVGITAFDGGKIKQMSDLSIHVPTKEKEYGPAEDAHMILDHLISAYLGRAISI